MIDYAEIAEFTEAVYTYLALSDPHQDMELAEIVSLNGQKAVFGLSCVPSIKGFYLHFSRDSGKAILDPTELLFSPASLQNDLKQLYEKMKQADEQLICFGVEPSPEKYNLLLAMKEMAMQRRDLHGNWYHVPKHRCDTLVGVPDENSTFRLDFHHDFQGEAWHVPIFPQPTCITMYMGHRLVEDDIQLIYQDRELQESDKSYIDTFFNETKTWYKTLCERKII